MTPDEVTNVQYLYLSRLPYSYICICQDFRTAISVFVKTSVLLAHRLSEWEGGADLILNRTAPEMVLLVTSTVPLTHLMGAELLC